MAHLRFFVQYRTLFSVVKLACSQLQTQCTLTVRKCEKVLLPFISYPDQLVCFALQVKLADRALLPGDVVKFSDVNRGTQKGFVGNVEVAASVKVLVANQIFHNLDCKELSPLQV